MNTHSPTGPLIMVVEDDLLVAGTLEIALESKDYRVLGPVETVDEALALMQTQRPDVALIDYRLATTTSEKLLAPLRERHIPVCVLTGLSADELPPSYAGCRVLQKPFRLNTLLDALSPDRAQ